MPKTSPGSFCSPQPASADCCSKSGANDSRDRYQSFGIMWTTHVSGLYLPNFPVLKPKSSLKVWHRKHGQMAPVLSCYLHLGTKPSFWGTQKQGNPSRSHPSQCCPTADQAATPQPAEFSNLSSSSPRQHKLTIKIHFSKPSGAAFAQSSCRTALPQGSCSSPMQQHPKRVWCSWRAVSLEAQHVLFSSFQKREFCWERRPGTTGQTNLQWQNPSH